MHSWVGYKKRLFQGGFYNKSSRGSQVSLGGGAANRVSLYRSRIRGSTELQTASEDGRSQLIHRTLPNLISNLHLARRCESQHTIIEGARQSNCPSDMTCPTTRLSKKNVQKNVGGHSRMNMAGGASKKGTKVTAPVYNNRGAGLVC